MSVETKSLVRLTRIINADRERVFSAWTQPEQIKKWSAPEVTILHELFPAEEARDGHEKGWTSCLNRLETLFG